MQLKKVLSVEAETTDGKMMVEGTDYVIILSDRSLCGTYRGITKKSALMFETPVRGESIQFNIMPGSVKKIYEATIEVKREYMNKPEVSDNEN